MYSLLRPLLFKLDPELAHDVTLATLDYMPRFCFKQPEGKSLTVMGLQFAHPIGLAAGLDKNGDHLDALAKLGFAFIELGTITPKPQAGNPKPRLFRLAEAQAIINRMGFNNKGVDALVANVQKAQYQGILGINIGKNKDTSLDKAAHDYLICMQKVYAHASYITINISSPNTPDLRQLQQAEYFADLLGQISQEQKRLADIHKRDVPLAVKVSPDETPETLKNMTEIIIKNGVQALIATNTTSSRPGVNNVPGSEETGGLSGRPLQDMSTNCLQLLKSYVGDAVSLIGVGGIDSPEAAQQKIKAGASLLQVYTGLIYKGPELVNQLVRALC